MTDTDAHVSLEQLASDLKALRQQGERVRKVVDAAARGNALLVAPGLPQIAPRIAALHDLARTVANLEPEQVENALQNAIAAARLALQGQFEDAIAGRAWALAGQWPHYVVQHLVPVRFDVARQRVMVSNRLFRSLHLVAPLEYLSALLRELDGRRFDATDFLAALQTAYKAVAARSSRLSAIVPVLEVYRELARSRGAYTLELFGVDLSDAVRLTEVSGIRLSPARSPRSAVYVPDASGGTYVSGIRIHQIA